MIYLYRWFNMKKKIAIAIAILIVILSIGGLLFASITLNKEQKELENRLIELTYDELSEKINNKETFILVITQTDCSHCEEYKPVLKQVLFDYDITAYEIDQKKISEEEKNNLKNIANISGTPTTVFIVNGEERQTSDRLVGSASRSKIIDRLKAMGYINE